MQSEILRLHMQSGCASLPKDTDRHKRMLELSVDVQKSSSFLGTRKTLAIEAELRLASPAEDIPISILLERLFESSPEFIPSICFQTSAEGEQPVLIEDLRGRPVDTFPETERSALDALRRSQEEELFFTDGVILETEEAAEEGPAPEEKPFFLRITSKFETFKNSRHIVYRVLHSETPALEEIRPDLSARLLARLLPLRLDTIRLGLENYRGRSFGAMFGIVPTVQDRLYLEITRSSIRLFASSDAVGKNPPLPFAEQKLLWHLDTALRDCSLFPNFFDRVNAAVQ
jgi:hypothetical protein